jgi:Na+-driven multidrug efflux pump
MVFGVPHNWDWLVLRGEAQSRPLCGLSILPINLIKKKSMAMLPVSCRSICTIVVNHFHEIIPIVANFIVLFGGLLMFHVLFSQRSVPSYAAISLILPWIKVGSLFVNSWTQSSTILVSQRLGKNDLKAIPNLVSQSIFVSIIMCVIMVIGFYLFSLFIPYVFEELSTETITALAIIAPVYILIPVFRVNNMFCGNMIRAMGESYAIVRFNIITQWLIALPTCALLIYLDAPLFLVFGVILMDEILKFIPFRNIMARKLNSYV